MVRRNIIKPKTLALSLLIAAIAFSGFRFAPATNASPVQSSDSEWTHSDDYGYVYSMSGDEVVCRPVTPDIAPFLFEHDPDLDLNVISRREISTQAGSEITFVLRGTNQLEANQQAKAVFLRAADIWKAQLQSPVPITIIIDVDFGTTFFGQTFDDDVLGGTLSQQLTSNTGYNSIRNSLIGSAETAEEVNLYNLLPTNSLVTDIENNVQGFTAPSALLRALGQINAVANPAQEPNFGNPPRIGFNSSFNFDFDPTNGITPGTIDFEAVAVHEIGHLLGFASRVGTTELGSSTLTVSPFDLFRFRPGVNLGNFTASQRILSSGGTQVFFAGGSELQVSTGRPDGSGGDGRQASHWKDDIFIGTKIGIMDPTIAMGERAVLATNDFLALDAMGYRLVIDPSGRPAIGAASANLAGDELTITGNVSDAQGDIAEAQVALLAANGSILRQDAPVPIDFGGATIASFTIEVAGLINVPAATQVRVVFRDEEGNSSQAATIDFSKADTGGPNLKVVRLNGSKLVIKGSGLIGQIVVEVNGISIASGNNTKKKIKLPGGQAANNLHAGANRVIVTVNGLRSNIFILNL